MTDLKMNLLCAEAMSIPHEIATDRQSAEFVEIIDQRNPGNGGEYDPLHDDAQAMALVKQFRLVLEPDGSCPECDYWAATWINTSREKGSKSIAISIAIRKSITLNAAIVECVAEMQKAKP